MAVEKYSNITPKIVVGNKHNYKITTQEDLNLMKLLLGDKDV